MKNKLALKKKRWYDDDADWVPQKGMQFVMKKGKFLRNLRFAPPLKRLKNPRQQNQR